MPALNRSMVGALLIAATLTACSTAPNPQPGLTTDSNVECPADANLLVDPTFATLGGREDRVWGQSQHARGRDFDAQATGGTLTITKIGHEPWFLFSQRIKAPIPAGAELQYDALIAFETHEPEDTHGFGYVSGLHLAGFAGRSRLFTLNGDHAPNLGSHPEQRVVSRVVAEQPLTSLTAGFIHQAGGALIVRTPRLIDVSAHPECRLP